MRTDVGGALDRGSQTKLRPVVGVSLELLALAASLIPAPLVPSGAPLFVYVASVQLLSTYLVHCPAHFIVGIALGVRFRSMRLGRTTLARVLPQSLGSAARLIPVLTLRVEKESLAGLPRTRIASMYAAGTAASVASALAVAIVAAPVESPLYAALTWAVALGYLSFDVVFSPRSGDLSRARAALAR